MLCCAATPIKPSPAEVKTGEFLIQQRLERLYAEQPVPWDRVLHEQHLLFNLYPFSEDGKAALFEVARIERLRGNPDAAQNALKQLIEFYPRDVELLNFWVGGGPIDLRAAAQLGWARALFDSGDSYSALQLLDDAALRWCEGTVGSPYDPQPWYGPAQVERNLLRAELLARQGQGAEAADSLLAALADHGDEPRLQSGRMLSAAQVLLDALERLLCSNAVEPPRLYMVLQLAQQQAGPGAARARALLLQAAAVAERARLDDNRSRLAEAADLYERAAIEMGTLDVLDCDQVLPAGVVAVRRIAGLTELGCEPQQALQRLQALSENRALSRPAAGQAWLCRARLAMDRLNSPGEAGYALGRVLDKYGDVPSYGPPGSEPTLAGIALRLQRKLGK